MGIFDKKPEPTVREALMPLVENIFEQHVSRNEDEEWDYIDNQTPDERATSVAIAISSFTILTRCSIMMKEANELTAEEYETLLNFGRELQFTFKQYALYNFMVSENRKLPDNASEAFFDAIFKHILTAGNELKFEQAIDLDECLKLFFEAFEKAQALELSITSGVDNVVPLNRDLH